MQDDLTPAPEAGEEVTPEVNEAEADQTESEQEGEESPEQKSRSQERRERRKAEMDRLRQSEAEAAQRLRDAEDRLRKVREQAQKLPEPKEADFVNFESYQAALAAHYSVKALDGRQVEEALAEAKARKDAMDQVRTQQKREAVQNLQVQMEEARTRYADFDQIVKNPDVPITERMVDMFASSDVAADIAYRLASDRTLAAEIAQMSDIDMARAIGRLEATVSAPKPRTQSSAPEPITPVRPTASPVKDPDKMTPAEYRAWREKGGKPS